VAVLTPAASLSQGSTITGTGTLAVNSESFKLNLQKVQVQDPSQSPSQPDSDSDSEVTMTGPDPAAVTGSLATRSSQCHGQATCLEVQRFAVLRLFGQCHWHRHGGGYGPSPELTLQVKHIDSEYSLAGQNDQTLLVSFYVTGCMH
jgi:hypothetical protein